MNRTQEEGLANLMDWDLDALARRAAEQAFRSNDSAHWEKVSIELERVRIMVRQKMNEKDIAVTQ